METVVASAPVLINLGRVSEFESAIGRVVSLSHRDLGRAAYAAAELEATQLAKKKLMDQTRGVSNETRRPNETGGV